MLNSQPHKIKQERKQQRFRSLLVLVCGRIIRLLRHWTSHRPEDLGKREEIKAERKKTGNEEWIKQGHEGEHQRITDNTKGWRDHEENRVRVMQTAPEPDENCEDKPKRPEMFSLPFGFSRAPGEAADFIGGDLPAPNKSTPPNMDTAPTGFLGRGFSGSGSGSGLGSAGVFAGSSVSLGKFGLLDSLGGRGANRSSSLSLLKVLPLGGADGLSVKEKRMKEEDRLSSWRTR